MFPSTRQTLLHRAAAKSDGQGHALNAVMEMYWQPCYRYVMRRFHAVNEEAQDLAQSFFVALVEEQILERYDPGRGPFRPYLRACLDQFVQKDLQRKKAEKRGGRALLVPLDEAGGLPGPDETPDEIFQREWQREMFTLAAEDLRKLCEDTERGPRYQVFAEYDLSDEPRPSYEELARAHEIPVTTVTNYLAWARRELRRCLEARVGGITTGERERKRELGSLLTSRPR